MYALNEIWIYGCQNMTMSKYDLVLWNMVYVVHVQYTYCVIVTVIFSI